LRTGDSANDAGRKDRRSAAPSRIFTLRSR
jgi:hypothetical protein